jgi:hypothetical protein
MPQPHIPHQGRQVRPETGQPHPQEHPNPYTKARTREQALEQQALEQQGRRQQEHVREWTPDSARTLEQGRADEVPRDAGSPRGPVNRRKGKKPRKAGAGSSVGGGDGSTGGNGGGSGNNQGKKGKRPLTRARRIRRRVFRSTLLVLLIVFGYVAYTIEPYLTYTSSDPVAARVAEWGRDHHLSFAVTWLENTTYKAPPVGGKLSSQQVKALQGATVAPSQAAGDELPANIPPLAAGSVPGEGVWHPAVLSGSGVPLIEWAGLRPDAQHTSELAYIAWMNQKALSFQLHPGSQQPGGAFPTPDVLAAGSRKGLVATWNGGFKVNPNDSLSGYYEDGQSVRPLVPGKASEVFYKDGSVKIGDWDRDVSMNADVSGVRQNLSLLVDNGQVTAAANSGSGAQWGVTVNNAFFVPRSGVGITAKGDVIYAGGPDLSVLTLAKLLKQAGAVDAMELDINADWTSYMYYNVPGGENPTDPVPTKLWDFKQPADRYYQPSSRDFVAVYVR